MNRGIVKQMRQIRAAALVLSAAVFFLATPLWAGEVLMSESGLANWLQQKFLPREQRLDSIEHRTETLENRLADWEFNHLSRFYLWPDSTRVEYYHPGGLSAGAAELDVPPRIVDGRTMVPLRFVGEALGAEVLWNGETGQVAYIVGARQVLLTIGQRSVIVNGRALEIDTAPLIIQDRTLVPIRFVSQWLGAIVKWEDSLKRVEISYIAGGLGAG